nr:hypothetical protein BaRGS_021900 [Batillaria attramentaria]
MIPEPPEDYADEETPMIRPKDIKKRASEMFDKIRIKQEHEDDEVSYIVVDDLDYYMFEDDSVIYMGEEDCQILDLSNNVSMIDLDDTISLDAEDDCYLE